MQNLQEVVVTATATQVRKLDASYNVVSADNELIKESNPLGSADILKIAPVIWPGASGGQTGANIEVAGYPSGGDSPFFTNMIQGMPLYGSPNLAYMDSSSLFRLDETIDRVEVAQGGPSVVFGPGQFGGTANYILKTGKNSPGGVVEATYGSEGMWRGDAYDGFQIANGWYGSVGGYYTKSHGVRDSQFPAIDGCQFTATLTNDISGGTVTAWARALNEKDEYITPIPIIQNADRSYSGYPGFDPLTGTFNGYATENMTLANPNGGIMNANLANGRGSQLYYFGVNYDQKIGGWTLHNGYYEVGYKFQAKYVYVDLNVWHRTFDGIFYQQSDLSGVPIPGGYGTYGSTASGVDFDGYIGPFAGLTLRFVGDYMDGHYTNNHSCLAFVDINGNHQCVFINGAPLQRQPKFHEHDRLDGG